MPMSSSAATPFGNGLIQVVGLPTLLVQMLDGVTTPVYVKNTQHQWVFANAACCALLGRSRQHLLSQPETDFWPPSHIAELRAQEEAALAGAAATLLPLEIVDAAGQQRCFQRRLETVENNSLLISFLDPLPEGVAVADAEPATAPQPLWNTPQFSALLANVPAMIYQFRLHPDGSPSFAFVSPGAYEVYGLPAATIQANPQVVLDRIHPLDRAGFDASMAASARALTPWRWEGRYYKPNQELRWLQTAARPQAQADGTILWDGLLMDITNRKQAEAATLERAVMEQALADNETRFRTIAATIPGALFQLRVQGDKWQVDYVSDRIQNIAGIPAADIIHNIHIFTERVHPSDRTELRASVEASVAQMMPWNYEGRLITPDGETRWWRGDAVPVPEAQGTVVFCGVMLDITARKQIEEAYRESERRLRMALDVSGMSVWSWDAASDRMVWSNEIQSIFGSGIEGFCQTFSDYLERIHPEDRRRLQDVVNLTLNQGGDYHVEYRVLCADERICWVGERGGLWRDVEGLVLGLAGTIVDITERKAAEAALQESETRYRTLLSNIPGAVYRRCVDESWTPLFHSEAIADLTGYGPDHPIHQNGFTLIYGDDRDPVEAAIQRAIAQQQPYDLEYRLCHASGNVRWVQDKGQPIFDADGTAILMDGVLTDITRRKESESRYRNIARREALINRISAQIRESLKLEAILQTTVQAIRSQLKTDRVVVYRFKADWHGQVVVEDVIAPWRSTLGEMGADTCFPNGYAEYYQSGRVRAIDNVQTADLDECHRDYLQSLQVQANLIVPILIQNRLWGLLIAHECGGPRHWNGGEIELLLSLAGQVGVAISQSDLYYQATENATRAQRQTQELETTLAELRRTQAQLVQTEKMSSLGQLVAGVAHEINNPVSFIDGNLSHAWEYAQDLLELVTLYQTTYPEPTAAIAASEKAIDLTFLMADFPKLLESMRVGADRIKNIVASLRNFSRMDEAEIKPVDIHDGLNSTLMILQHRLKANGDRAEIAIQKEYGELPLVECYAGQLNQVFMNLISNAIDALEGAIETGSPCDPMITIRTAVVDADCIRITIADNGPGIPADRQKRIFEPFYTTKPVGKGTGIGLSISYQIIRDRHHGTLECQSSPGHGTQFIMTIPQQQGTT
ncbi:PAS domain-containing protein [Leptolyngbya sp. PCC 6406]|uniref:PAS domain-containing protein n=1 Tax=Leptolyngbya sp. PCC 6406 TaxID=1173264 RepID=UPI0002ABA988|nr:PAS domain-containing protein [Leptolyngbya sp. PCC 6406]